MARTKKTALINRIVARLQKMAAKGCQSCSSCVSDRLLHRAYIA